MVSDKVFDISFSFSQLGSLSTGARTHTQWVRCLYTDTFECTLSGLSVVSDKLFDILYSFSQLGTP